MTTPDLHTALLAAFAAEQQQLDGISLPWEVMGSDVLARPGGGSDYIAAEADFPEIAEFIAATANRAQALLDLRREIAERHAPAPTGFCQHCDDWVWPCPDYLTAARATLPADHPALTA